MFFDFFVPISLLESCFEVQTMMIMIDILLSYLTRILSQQAYISQHGSLLSLGHSIAYISRQANAVHVQDMETDSDSEGTLAECIKTAVHKIGM